MLWWLATDSHLPFIIGDSKPQLAIKHQIRLQMHQRIEPSSIHLSFRVRIPYGAVKGLLMKTAEQGVDE